MPSVAFRMDLPDGIDVAGSLEPFRRSGDDLIDRWDGQRLIRVVRHGNDTWVPFVARLVGQPASPGFEVRVEDTTHVDVVRTAVLSSVVPAPADYGRLLADDPTLARLDALFPGIRQIRQLDLFTALVRCISAQQVNLRWAVTTRRRLAEAFESSMATACTRWIRRASPPSIRSISGRCSSRPASRCRSWPWPRHWSAIG
jgi:DNA-3-methyladenine glycosylase II